MATISPVSMAEFREQIERVYRAAGKAPKTIKQVDHVLRLVEAVGVTSTAEINTDAVARIVLARGDANPNTTRGILARLRAAVNFAIRRKWVDRDDEPDWRSLRPRASEPTRNRPHTEEEVARLIELLARERKSWYGGRLHALVSLVGYTGLRRNEALFARVDDVDLMQGFFFVSPRNRTKTKASVAPVPLPAAAVNVLSEWVPRCGGEWLFPGARSAGPWTGGAPGYRPIDRMRQAAARVYVEGVGFHSLRHSLATHLLRRGVPTWAIQRILRHTTLRTTNHYLHPTDIDVATFVRDFEYRARPSLERPA